jgi:23S rRNA (guanosine2251-2'-O)-methyltransferase
VDWLYGRQVVRLACADGAKRRPHRLAATAEGLAWLAAHGVGVNGRPAADRGARRGASAANSFEVETVTSSDLQQLTGSRDHQGAACLVGDYPYVAPDSLLAGELLVVLDEVTDPRNLGAIARSALAAGAGGLVLPRHRSAAVTPAAVKASAGATEHLDIAHVTNVVAFLGQAKQAGAWVYGAEGAADRPYDALDLGGRVAFVFGAEGRGLRPLVRRACDELAAIPMQGPVGSLNVSVAAALFLFEARRQRAAAAPAGSATPATPAGRGPSSTGHGPGSPGGA